MIAIVVAVLSLIATVITVGYARTQNALAKRLKREQEERDREETEWQVKQERLANLLARIGPYASLQIPSTERTPQAYIPYAYNAIYPDHNLRRNIETYIIEPVSKRDVFDVFQVRKPEPHVLRSPTFRKTVEEATAIMDKYKADNPESYRITFGVD